MIYEKLTSSQILYMINMYLNLKMLKIILMTIMGLCITLIGFYIAFFYVTGIDQGRSPWLLLLTPIFVAIGVYLLLQAGKLDDSVVAKAKIDKSEKKVSVSILERNNKLSDEWSKTVDARDRLKLLEMSAKAKETSD